MDRRSCAALVVCITAASLVLAGCGTKGTDGQTAVRTPPLTSVVSSPHSAVPSSSASRKAHRSTTAVSCLNARACGDRPPPPTTPCPAHQAEPSFGNTYCGPNPNAGNGFGSSGECTGHETAAPCGPGMIVGRYYAYTLPGRCDGRLIVDGRHWLSELPPPTPVPDMYVWVSIRPGDQHAGFISPNGSVGFDIDRGQPTPVCSEPPVSVHFPIASPST